MVFPFRMFNIAHSMGDCKMFLHRTLRRNVGKLTLFQFPVIPKDCIIGKIQIIKNSAFLLPRQGHYFCVKKCGTIFIA